MQIHIHYRPSLPPISDASTGAPWLFRGMEEETFLRQYGLTTGNGDEPLEVSSISGPGVVPWV